MPNTTSRKLHVLVFDRDQRQGLAHAIQLSGYGLIVETVRDIEETARRLSTVEFDAVLFNLRGDEGSLRGRLDNLRRAYPKTEFYMPERIKEFFSRIGRPYPAA